jgi:hypothetical protein
MNATLTKISKIAFPAVLMAAFAGGAFAADVAKTAPAAKQHAPTHQVMKMKRARAEADANLQQTASEADNQRHNSRAINNDAGVPPSGVPSDTRVA